jgi:hypothetical protein
MSKPQNLSSHWTLERRKAMSEKLKKHNAERKAKEVIVAAVQSDSIPEILRKIELQGKGLDAQNKVLFSKLYNLQVEIQESNKKLTGLLAILLDIMHQDSPTMNEAQSVIRDFLFNKHKQP